MYRNTGRIRHFRFSWRRPMEWPKVLYEMVGVRHPIFSTAMAALVGAVVFGFIWYAVIGGDVRRKAAEAAAAAAKPEFPIQNITVLTDPIPSSSKEYPFGLR